jgi:hypothetical protein
MWSGLIGFRISSVDRANAWFGMSRSGLEQSGKEWFLDLWRAHGWSEEDGRVWRVEFSFKREVLHELQQENTSHEVAFGGSRMRTRFLNVSLCCGHMRPVE